MYCYTVISGPRHCYALTGITYPCCVIDQFPCNTCAVATSQLKTTYVLYLLIYLPEHKNSITSPAARKHRRCAVVVKMMFYF